MSRPTEKTLTPLGHRIKVLCAEHQMTQIDLAARVPMSAQHLSQMLFGDHDPLLSRIVKIADVFGVSLDELVGRTPPSLPRK